MCRVYNILTLVITRKKLFKIKETWKLPAKISLQANKNNILNLCKRGEKHRILRNQLIAANTQSSVWCLSTFFLYYRLKLYVD